MSTSTMTLLAAAPEIQRRSETVDVPELGGAVVVRGLLASEVFAVSALRSQALRRVREARAEHDRRHSATAGAAAAEEQAAEPDDSFEPPALSFDELRTYGQYISHLLACAVMLGNGLALYTAEQWECVGQHHPAVLPRLQLVAERLSGLDSEDVRKNSPASPK